MSDIYAFGSEKDLDRVIAVTRAFDDLPERTPPRVNTVDQTRRLAEVTAVIDADSSDSGDVEVKATGVIATLDENLKIKFEKDPDTDAMQWDGDIEDAGPNLRLIPGQAQPTVGDIIDCFVVQYTSEEEEEPPTPEEDPVEKQEFDWFFNVFTSPGQSFFQAVVTAYYADGFVANIFALNQNVIEPDPGADPPVIGTTPLASNQQVPFGIPGAPTYLEIGQALVVMQQGLTYKPLGHVTI